MAQAGIYMVTFKKPNTIILISGGVIVVAVLVVVILSIINNGADKPVSDKNGTTPTFGAVLPKEKTIDSLGGWTERTSPSGNTYYEFTDTIGDTTLNVSQQALPDSFTNNSDSKVAEAAKAYNATRTFKAGGTKVYSGTKVNGPQSIIFTKNDTLVFIIAQKEIQDTAWISYIESLN